MHIPRALLTALALPWILASSADSYAAATVNNVDIGDIAVVGISEGSWPNEMCQFMPDCYLATVSQLFYKTHKDKYDVVFVFTSGAVNENPIQQGWVVYHPVKGIGRDYYWDQRTRFGVPGGKLKIVVNMGSLDSLPANPEDVANIVPFFPLTGAELMGHEFGHFFGISIKYKDIIKGATHCWARGFECSKGGESGGCMYGYGPCDGYEEGDFNQHWSYYFNSRSVMYGSFIEDLGGGQFKMHYDAAGYSELDQYLLGLRSAEDVDNSQLFLVDTTKDGDPTFGSASIPMGHKNESTVTGKKISFTMNEIIASLGQRVPTRDPCHMKAAFVLSSLQTRPYTKAHVAKLDVYRKRWETYYDWATSNRGSFDTTLNNHGPGTGTCPAPNYPDGGYPPDYDGGATDDDAGSGCTKCAVDQNCGSSTLICDDSCCVPACVDKNDCLSNELCNKGRCKMIQTDGGPDSGKDGGAKPDGSVSRDGGSGDDTGDEDEDSGNDAGRDGGKKKTDGGSADDQAAGCSCAVIGL